jgi:NitT/TauT family transport system permease protein
MLVTAGLGVVFVALICYVFFEAYLALKVLTTADLLVTVRCAGVTFARVFATLVIASAWTIPAGVAAGFNPRIARFVQPLAQIAASVPATALFPVILLALISMGGGLGTGSILLMLLGTQWYVLFNVIAGAMAIPSDLREAADVFHFSRWQRWKTVILPGIFPYLVTGLVTASGGAWNASIVSEAVSWGPTRLSGLGLGAYIAQMTEAGDFPRIALGVAVMSMFVIAMNRLLWRPLYAFAERRTRLD